MTPEDRWIVDRLKSPLPAAREEAMRDLLRRHGGAVRAALARHVARRHDLDDLLQDVWLKVYRARDRISPDAEALRPWLYRIARNVLLDQLRRRRPAEAPAVDAPVAPDRTLEHRDELDALHREFHRRREDLSPKQRHCIERLLAGRFEAGALANEHACTRESVQMELLRGLRKLGWR